MIGTVGVASAVVVATVGVASEVSVTALATDSSFAGSDFSEIKITEYFGGKLSKHQSRNNNNNNNNNNNKQHV